MKNFVKLLGVETTLQIGNIESENIDLLSKIEKVILILRSNVNKLNCFISDYTFKTEREEISFFRKYKPKIFGDLFYNVELFRIESEKVFGTGDVVIDYYRKELGKIEDYFNKHIHFYRYFTSQLTSKDSTYFLRENNNNMVEETVSVYCNDQSITDYDIVVAKIIGYEHLHTYLESEIKKLQKVDEVVNIIRTLNWTCKKSELIELIYAMIFSKSIENGEREIKEVMMAFEQLFNIDLSDAYRVFSDIKIRQNPTKYIDLLKDCLNKRIQLDFN